jgi:hypothetical protein
MAEGGKLSRTMAHHVAAALLAGSVIAGSASGALAAPTTPAPLAPAEGTAACGDLGDIASLAFGGLTPVLGPLAGTPTNCPYVDPEGTLLLPTTTGLFAYDADQDISSFTDGAEDWVLGDGVVTFYASPDAPGVLATPSDPTPGAPRPAAPSPAAPPEATVVASPSTGAPAAPAPAGGAALGGTYDVTGKKIMKNFTLEVSADGSQITTIGGWTYCTPTDNPFHLDTITFAPSGPFPIGPDGKVSVKDLKETQDRVTYTYSLEATFSGGQASGTLSVSSFVQGPAAYCRSGQVDWTATHR